MFLILIFFTHVFSHVVIPAYIYDVPGTGKEVYAATVVVGSPAATRKLQISFEHNKVILHEDAERRSSKYDKKFGGTDIIHLGGKEIRIPIISDPYKKLRVSEIQCPDCEGILGLAEGSVFWRMWPNIAFSRGSITFGAIHKDFHLSANSPNYLLHCHDDLGGYLCKTNATVKFGVYTYQVEMDLDIGQQTIQLPADIYDTYTKGKSFINDDVEKWETIKIYARHPDSEHAKKSKINYGNSKEEYEVEHSTEIKITGPDLISQSPRTARFERIDLSSNEGGRIRLGTRILRDFVVQKNDLSENAMLHASPSSDHMPAANIYIFIVIGAAFMMWRITDYVDMGSAPANYTSLEIESGWRGWVVSRHKQIRNRPITLFFEFAIPILVFVSNAVLESSRNILMSYPLVYWLVWVILIVAAGFKITSLYLSKSFKQEVLGRGRHVQSSNIFDSEFELRIMRNLSQEVILLTGGWILLLPRRIDALSNILVFGVSIYITFTVFSYILLIIFYFSQKKWSDNFNERGILWFLLYNAILTVLQAAASIQYFYPPFMVANTRTYVTLILPLTIFLFILAFILAFYTLKLYVRIWKRTGGVNI